MGNPFKHLIFSIIFLITAITAQAAGLIPEIPDGTSTARPKENALNDSEVLLEKLPPEPVPSLEQSKVPVQRQPSIQKITETEKKIQSNKKKSGKRKLKKKKRHKTTPSTASSQQTESTKTASEQSDTKRVEKWLEENEASEKENRKVKVKEPVKKLPQTFSVYLSPESTENKTDSKQPERTLPYNLNLPLKTSTMLPQKKLKPPLAPESNEKRLTEAAKTLQSDFESAESGDAEAQLSVGIKLYTGQGVFQNRKTGFKWLLKAAENGRFSAESLNILGQAYFKGTDTDKNYVEARKWLCLLADKDNYSAKNDLAYMLYNGFGGDKDYPKAFNLYKQASKHGDVFAQANLGLMYATGTGTEMDKARAYAWYSLAASQGNTAAAKNRNVLLKDMSWKELNAAQQISIELYNEVENNKGEKSSVNTGQLEQQN